MAVNLSPILNGWQSFLPSGLVNAGGFVYIYAAGTTTPTIAYTSSAGNVLTANPITLSPTGFPPYEIWLVQGVAYKLVVEDQYTNVIATYDNIVGVNDIGVALTQVSANIVPTVTNTYNLGSSGFKWNQGYINTVFGSNWNGSLTVTGNVSTSGSGTFANLVLGNSNIPGTLSYYQETAPTPTISYGGTSTGVTYSSQVCSQTRFGRLVFFDLNLTVTSNGSATGVAVVSGPTVAPVTATVCSFICLINGVPNLAQMTNSGTLNLFTWAGVQLTDATLTPPAIIQISGTYTT